MREDSKYDKINYDTGFGDNLHTDLSGDEMMQLMIKQASARQAASRANQSAASANQAAASEKAPSYSAYNLSKEGCSEAELRSLYLLNNMTGMFSDKLLRIYEHFGSYEYAYNADIREYIEAGLIVKESAKAAFAELKKRETLLLRRAEGLEDKGIHLVTMFDSEYPERLDAIKNKPPLLYVSGSLPDDNRRAAAMVGSRKCSEYGRTVAEMFAAELAEHDVQIVSGLAHGIDGAAARGSLRSAAESYGVLGCGVNVCYPKFNESLYDRMRQGEGGIVSELPLDAPALGYNFVLRNRIISGLSDVLIVIEAGRKSGTSITVGYALDQGREVYALPGRIDDPLGYGCNQLIKEGANIITEAADIIRYFELKDGSLVTNDTDDSDKPHTDRRLEGLDADERSVYAVLKLEPQHVEAIAGLAGLKVADTVTALMMLEAKGLIRSPRYAYYQRISMAR